MLVVGGPRRVGDAHVAATGTRLGCGARRARAPAVDGAEHRAAVCDRSGRAPGSCRRTRCIPGGGNRHVHRRGRHRPADRRRWPWLSAPGGRIDCRGPSVGSLRARPGGVQGRGWIPVADSRPDSGRVGASRLARPGPGHAPAPRRWRPPWCAAAAPPASTSTASTPSPGPPTPASASPRSAPSRPFCSTDSADRAAHRMCSASRMVRLGS